MNRNLSFLLVAATLTVGFAVLAQNQGQTGAQGQTQSQQTQAAPTQPPGAVSGVVISATTGEPLRKVSLTLQPQGRGGGSATTISTDSSGAFRFPSVDVGTYRLSGQRTGYVAGTYGQDRPGAQPREITVTTGQTTSGVQFKLIPQSVILGRVFDADGDPVQNSVVQVLRYTYQRGDRQLTTVQTGTTNDIGEFRVAGLSPGRYYVSALRALGLRVPGLNNADFGPGGGRGGRGGRGNQNKQATEEIQEDYVTTYYPKTIEPGGATPIDLVPGSEARGIDIGLMKVRQYRLSGVVDGVNLADFQARNNPDQAKNKQKGKQGGGFGGINVSLVLRATQPGLENIGRGSNATVDPNTGRFEFRAVAAGAYYIVAQTRGPQTTDQLTGRLAVDIGSGNQDNLTVRMTSPLALNGMIAPETADTTLNMKSVRITFTPSTPGGGGGRGGNNGRIDLDDKGKFQVVLPADSYTIEVTGAPAGYYMKSIRLAGREVPDAVLDLTVAGSQLDVILATGAGNIAGIVINAKGDPPGRVQVTAVPVSGSRRRDMSKAVYTADDGTYTISGLPPGKYKVFAWEEIEANSWMAPEFRRPFETRAVVAEITTSADGMADLKLIGRDETAIK